MQTKNFIILLSLIIVGLYSIPIESIGEAKTTKKALKRRGPSGLDREYRPSRVGCFGHLGELVGMRCTEQRVAFDILKTLFVSKKRSSKSKLYSEVVTRAKYFIRKEQFDYFSVVSLMLFPVPKREQWIKKFGTLPGKRAPFTSIALDRIHGKKSTYCRKKGRYKAIPIFLKEICTLSVDKI
ncbi:MAG: hypothetical protein HOE90_07625 [Bacteriovoracaceae bacterium]|mgnify:CR=1 FL=1|jgi:hypothetical protein|nr:hypothetical protein [Bacteriovoracaceae bacterium]